MKRIKELLGLCNHKYKIIEKVDLFGYKSHNYQYVEVLTGAEYILQCEHCGKIKKKRV